MFLGKTKGKVKRVIKVDYKGFTGYYDTEEVMPSPTITFHNWIVKKGKQVLLHKVYCDDAPYMDSAKLYEMTRNFLWEKGLCEREI